MSSCDASSGSISMVGSPVRRLMRKMSIERASSASTDWKKRRRIYRCMVLLPFPASVVQRSATRAPPTGDDLVERGVYDLRHQFKQIFNAPMASKDQHVFPYLNEIAPQTVPEIFSTPAALPSPRHCHNC